MKIKNALMTSAACGMAFGFWQKNIYAGFFVTVLVLTIHYWVEG